MLWLSAVYVVLRKPGLRELMGDWVGALKNMEKRIYTSLQKERRHALYIAHKEELKIKRSD